MFQFPFSSSPLSTSQSSPFFSSFPSPALPAPYPYPASCSHSLCRGPGCSPWNPSPWPCSPCPSFSPFCLLILIYFFFCLLTCFLTAFCPFFDIHSEHVLKTNSFIH